MHQDPEPFDKNLQAAWAGVKPCFRLLAEAMEKAHEQMQQVSTEAREDRGNEASQFIVEFSPSFRQVFKAEQMFDVAM